MRTPSAPESAPVVIRISPMAHIAVGFLTLGLAALVFAGPPWFVVLLLIPVVLSIVIARYRTVAGRDTVTARTLLGRQTVPWDDIDGLRFGRRAWAVARRRDGSEFPLPAVTFSTLPVLTEASGGRVPNPYESGSE
ncbi:PH domain-containing protein [Mycobacterium sp. 236(2023)]|uniref:PH domain-containing protein n=1 Tax=Mycobacterium sp. 236(2023) TaxID=3038163 RepID=UPI002415853A|nr:PH domain-containing protein [Mycobacterium sp. 236(2023)]MDG4664739.1 PH domain-containing protein [Mycobacterium sp. 236(2023)]